MKYLKKINEVVTPREVLYPRDEIEHKNRIEPALLTFDEYFKILQEGAMKKYHDDNIYNYSLETNENGFEWRNIGNYQRIKTKKYDNIIIDFYRDIEEYQYIDRDEEGNPKRDDNGEFVYKDNKELNKQGKLTKSNTIIAVHRDEDLVIGFAGDEWGSVLVTILKEYRGIDIGDELIQMYMHYYPYKGTGGVTSYGYRLLKRFHTHLVKKYLQNGIYSYLVRNKEITAERVKEIVNSINKDKIIKKSNEFSKTYGGSGKMMYYIDNNTVVIFDETLVKTINTDLNERFQKRLLKCFIYINQFKQDVDYDNLFTIYAENDKYFKEGLDILLSQGIGISDYFYNKRFDNRMKSMIDKAFKNNDYILSENNKGYDSDFRIIKLKERKFNFNELKKKADLWFKQNDKYDEFQSLLLEFAEGIADIY